MRAPVENRVSFYAIAGNFIANYLGAAPEGAAWTAGLMGWAEAGRR